MKVDQPNVQELEGKGPDPDNGAIPRRVVAVGRTSEIKNIAIGSMRTDQWRKETVSDDKTKEGKPSLI